jgi:hypothetical protein
MKSPDWLMNRNDMLGMYQQYPGALAEELDYVFCEVKTDEERAVHNHVIRRLSRLCIDRPRLLKNVATAILKTLIHEGATQNGKGSDSRESTGKDR